MKLRVALLFGGRSVEHEVSLISARSVLNALDRDKYDVIPLAIAKDGRWLQPAAALALLPPGPDAGLLPAPIDRAPAAALDEPRHLLPGIDVVFPLVHGTHGEDGTLQGLLELAGVPYVGAGVAASAVGMDKVLMKRLFREAGIPVTASVAATRSEYRKDPRAFEARVGHEPGLPCFVKPANGGSSVGVTKCRTAAELREGLELAFRLDRKVLVEAAFPGRELECSVLGNDAPTASAVGEIVTDHEFYDYAAKYQDGATRLIVPAGVPDAVAAAVRDLAVRAFRAVDCAGMARVDFFYNDGDGRLLVNEINTIPGFTPMSMYPRMWEAAGLNFPALLDRLIELAMERHTEQQQSKFDLNAVQTLGSGV